MKTIAIKGHPTRGKEVIKILESLGGNNLYVMTGSTPDCGYYINSCYNIDGNPLGFVKKIYQVYTLEEFEKEFPFKIGDKVKVLTDISYKVVALEYYMGRLWYKLDNGLHYSSEMLTFYKEMKEERNITLTLDKAKEWYKQGGDLKEVALQAFTEQELNPLPKNWIEYCKMYPTIQTKYVFASDAPQKYIAFWKLEQLRDCYRQGWKPNWTNSQVDKYCIVISANKPEIITLTTFSAFLSFQSREVAEEFLKTFDPLIKEAGDLI